MRQTIILTTKSKQYKTVQTLKLRNYSISQFLILNYNFYKIIDRKRINKQQYHFYGNISMTRH